MSKFVLWLFHSNFLCRIWCILFWLYQGRIPERGTYSFYSLKWKVCFVFDSRLKNILTEFPFVRWQIRATLWNNFSLTSNVSPLPLDWECYYFLRMLIYMSTYIYSWRKGKLFFLNNKLNRIITYMPKSTKS